MSERAGDPHRFEHGQPTYLQLPASDVERSARFYEAVFGWQVDLPHSGFTAPGIFGQWVGDRPPASDGGPLLWLHVDDIDTALDRAREYGGTVVEEPSPDGPSRILATARDPGGNAVGLVQHRAA